MTHIIYIYLLLILQTTFPSKCTSQNNAPPQIVYILILRNHKYVTLHDERDFADVTELRTLSEKISWITKVGPMSTQDPY